MPIFAGILPDAAMRFDDICAEVAKRSDTLGATDIIKRYVAQATLQVHAHDDWALDADEFTFLIDATMGTVFNYPTSNITKFRKVNRVYPIDAQGNEMLNYPIERVDPTSLLDYNNLPRMGYVPIRETLQFRQCSNLYGIKIFYQRYPDVGITNETYNSWIAELYPYAIIDAATQNMQNNSGNADLARGINMNLHYDTLRKLAP